MGDYFVPERSYFPGMGEAVADRTVNRKIFTGLQRKRLPKKLRINPKDPRSAKWLNAATLSNYPFELDEKAPFFDDDPQVRSETWSEVAKRVAEGNVSLANTPEHAHSFQRIGGPLAEFERMRAHIASGALLMSGRHLQHGDRNQRNRPLEIVTNCATAATSFLLFHLLLNGSGVGRAYDDAMMLVDWRKMPKVRVSIDDDYPDRKKTTPEWSSEAQALVEVPMIPNSVLNLKATLKQEAHDPEKTLVHEVADSREGWRKAIELIERMTYEGKSDWLLVLDFSKVRPHGSPIRGMQNRPSSGPGPVMIAITKIAQVRDMDLEPWEATMHIDHYAAECVLVGGARRSARMATKTWRDLSIFKFITIKSKGGLWSSNNSVTIDDEFRERCRKVCWLIGDRDFEEAGKLHADGRIDDMDLHAWNVLLALAKAAYFDKTGEPGLINQDKLHVNNEGIEEYLDGLYANGGSCPVDPETVPLMRALAEVTLGLRYTMITNPCVTADTWVMTGDGPRQVAELIDRPFTAIVDGKPYAATGFWKTGDKPVFKVTTDRGYEVRATDNHKLLVETSRRRRGGAGAGHAVETDWVEVKDLQPGDVLVLSNHSGVAHWGGDGTFNEGWLIGQMVGDGGYNPDSHAGYLRFWGPFMSERAARAQEMVKALPFSSHRPTALGPVRKANEANGSVTVSSRALDELAAGLIEPGTKRLLPALERRSAAFYMGFLRGIFDADGSVQGTAQKGVSVRLAQSNLERLRVIQRMLARFGIVATIYENRRDHYRREMPDGKGGTALYDCLPQHELVISRDNIVRFAEIVGFSDDVKQTRLAEVLGDRKRPIYRDRFTAEVVSIEPDGVEAVYDCTVETVHRFDANGIVAHNCGEIALLLLGGYCVIADVVPFHAADDDMAENAFRTAVRALMRTNLMKSIYEREVKRTNRIGVGITGFHEWAYARFGFTWKDIIDEEKSKEMWMTLSRFKRAIVDEARRYAIDLGVAVPHTNTTFKPAGTTSKLFGLTEGAHLPAKRWYLRWVQFRNDDPLVEEYEAKGYPVRRNLQSYTGTAIVGFPTAPTICQMDGGEWVKTAAEATPEEQYRFLRLLEKYWLRGVKEDGVTLLPEETGNQISYTLKYDPEKVDFRQFVNTLIQGQFTIRCCSVMPQIDETVYEYQPEEPLSKQQYEELMARIAGADMSEDVDFAHVDCGTGGCPIDFEK